MALIKVALHDVEEVAWAVVHFHSSPSIISSQGRGDERILTSRIMRHINQLFSFALLPISITHLTASVVDLPFRNPYWHFDNVVPVCACILLTIIRPGPLFQKHPAIKLNGMLSLFLATAIAGAFDGHAQFYMSKILYPSAIVQVVPFYRFMS